MSEKLNDIIQESIENHTEDYSREAWKRLKRELPVNKGALWLKAGLLTVLLVVVSFAVWYLPNKDTDAVEKNNVSMAKNTLVQKETEIIKPKQEFVNTESPTLKIEHFEASSPKEENKKQEYSETKKESVHLEDNTSIKEPEVTVASAEEKKSIQPLVTLDKLEGCTPLNIEYHISNTPETAKIEWLVDNKILSQASNGILTIKKAGRSKLSLRIYADELDDFYKEYEVNVWSLPTVEFAHNIDEEGLLEFRNVSKYKACQWFINDNLISEDQEGSLQLQNAGEYQFKMVLKNEKACVNQKTETIKYTIQHKVFAPTAFSPDGDGYNDEFIVKYVSHKSFTYTFQVFSTKGQLLFETSESDKGWSGEQDHNGQYYKNKKYLWRLIIQDASGNTETKQGYFTQL